MNKHAPHIQVLTTSIFDQKQEKRWSNEPGVDELDAGLHPRPGPVVGDGANDGTQPKRPLKHEQG
jgi:hypothetical protein